MNVFLDVEQMGFARRAKTEVGYAKRWFEDGRGATAVVRIDGAQRVWWCGGVVVMAVLAVLAMVMAQGLGD